MLPFFSIIIPTHKRSKLLKRAVESIRKNNFDEIEIIVISDICDAETTTIASEILNSNDIYVKRNGSCGPAESRNIGLQLASGKNIIFLDDDDSFAENYFNQILEAVEKNYGSILYSNFEIIEELRTSNITSITNRQKFSVKDINKQSVYVKNFIHNHTTVFPSSVLKNKYQDIHLSSLEDWDYLLNAHQNADLVYLDIFGPIIHRDPTRPGENRGTTLKALNGTVILDYLQIYKKYPCSFNPNIKLERLQLLNSAGFQPHEDWF